MNYLCPRSPKPTVLRRRCQTPDCLVITTAAACPRCHAVLVAPEPEEPAFSRRAWNGTTKACALCGDAFSSFNAKHIFCSPCGRARTDQLERDRYRRGRA